MDCPRQSRQEADASDSTIEELACRLISRLLGASQAMRRETETLPLAVAQNSVVNRLIDGPRKVAEPARAEGVRLPSMTQVVGRMEKAGRVTCSCENRRGTYVVITESGRALARDVRHADRGPGVQTGRAARRRHRHTSRRPAVARPTPGPPTPLAERCAPGHGVVRTLTTLNTSPIGHLA